MIYVGDSDLHGQGVFSNEDICTGQSIELCPYLVADEHDFAESCILHDYVFEHPEDKTAFLVVLGWGMVYNHSNDPNAEWEVCMDDPNFIRFFALCDIPKGTEITHDYGGQYWSSREEEADN